MNTATGMNQAYMCQSGGRQEMCMAAPFANVGMAAPGPVSCHHNAIQPDGTLHLDEVFQLGDHATKDCRRMYG